MAEGTVLGVHGWVDEKTQKEGGALDRFTDGHAWLSVARDGKTEYYGLWPDSHPDIVEKKQNDPDQSDIRIGREANSNPTASRYYTLSPEQAAKLEEALKENVSWGPTTTCAGWASDTVTDVTGKKLDATEFLSIETPRELIKTIKALEAKEPTAPDHPLAPIEKKPGSSDSFHAQGTDFRPPDAFGGLHQTSVAATHRLETSLARAYDASSERLAYAATVLAASEGMSRVDHIVLNEKAGKIESGERFFVVQGGLDDPAHHRAHGSTRVAVETPVERSVAQLREIEIAPIQKMDALALDQVQQVSPRTMS